MSTVRRPSFFPQNALHDQNQPVDPHDLQPISLSSATVKSVHVPVVTNVLHLIFRKPQPIQRRHRQLGVRLVYLPKLLGCQHQQPASTCRRGSQLLVASAAHHR
jgi:hypothetical protein